MMVIMIFNGASEILFKGSVIWDLSVHVRRSNWRNAAAMSQSMGTSKRTSNENNHSALSSVNSSESNQLI